MRSRNRAKVSPHSWPDKLTDYVSYFVHDSAPKAAVGAVTQVEALALSACKRASGARLSCITCHNPHDRPTQNRVQYFRGKCLDCHSAPKYASAHYPENPDCASCHMRRNQAGDIPHQQVTDHRILRVPEEAVTLAGDADPHALTPVLHAPLDDRDWGLAYAKLAHTYRTVIEIAYQYLRRARGLYPQDADVLAELAFLSEAKNLEQDALGYYEQALKIDPTNAFAGSRLGLLYWRAGDARRAISFWAPVFNRDPHFVGMNLAEAECSVGNRTRSVEVLKRLLHFFPDNFEAKQRLDEVESEPADCGAAAAPR